MGRKNGKRKSRPQMSKSERELIKLMRELQDAQFTPPEKGDALDRKIKSALHRND